MVAFFTSLLDRPVWEVETCSGKEKTAKIDTTLVLVPEGAVASA
jgi:hypothetical protein